MPTMPKTHLSLLMRFPIIWRYYRLEHERGYYHNAKFTTHHITRHLQGLATISGMLLTPWIYHTAVTYALEHPAFKSLPKRINVFCM
eukprot:2819725-Amphidinium_carterae.1